MGCGKSNNNTVNQSIVAKPPKSLSKELPNSKESETVDKLKIKKMTLEVGQIVIKNTVPISQNYTMSHKIGDGSHSFVRMAIHKLSGQKRAIKSIEKSNFSSEDAQLQFLNEINILKVIDHPNIVKLFEFYEDKTYYHLVTEYMPGGELFNYILTHKSLNESTAARFMKQILSAVAYCHDNDIVHRDIKSENFLIDNESPDAIVKLIDFGTSAIINKPKKLFDKRGNIFYIAPEILGKAGYNEKCDVWSCGVLLYILLSGKPPFYAKDDNDIIKKIITAEYSLDGPEWEGVSDGAIRLIEKMLILDPHRRISAREALQQQWISNGPKIKTSVSDPNAAAMENLQKFHIEQKLQHAVLAFLAANMLSKEESKQLYNSFIKIDKNNDGKLSREELLEVYCATMEREEATEKVNKIMESVDSNNSGFIEYSEFITASLKRECLINGDNLLIAFKAFDLDRSGKISTNELKEILGVTGEKFEYIETLITKVDENGDGVIDLQEFTNMMIHTFSEMG